jgi:exopolysaccharide production protein ExoQ
MKPALALLLCCPLIIWLWKRDQQGRLPSSKALWVPLFWLLVLGSRPVSWWLGIGGSTQVTDPDLEGNVFDRILYLAQIFLAICIVGRRNIDWMAIVRQNKALVLFFLFLLATVLWAEYPFVVFKRWFKEIGGIFVILVLLTEVNPLDAVKTTFARSAYILLPLSIVLMKYFPGIGKGYSKGGLPMITGVTDQKNSLGVLILVLGLVLISTLLAGETREEAPLTKGRRLAIALTLTMGFWLLFLSDSKTSQICLALGTMIVLGHRLPWLKQSPKRVLVLCVAVLPLCLIADNLFNISDTFLRLINRTSTLTERTQIWQAIKQNPVNPITGAGYMMYWDLHKGLTIDQKFYDIKSAHNGYLETYLDGGVLGLFTLAILLLGVGWRSGREFLRGTEYGRISFAFFVVMLLHNISEATFARRSPLWFAFLLFCIDVRRSPFIMRDIIYEEMPMVGTPVHASQVSNVVECSSAERLTSA